jgi:hypothetical protein
MRSEGGAFCRESLSAVNYYYSISYDGMKEAGLWLSGLSEAHLRRLTGGGKIETKETDPASN